MKKNVLLLIDVSKNFDIKEKNQIYVSLNKGTIILENCKKIYLKDFINLKKKKINSLLGTLKNFIYSDFKYKFFLAELEIFNLRNDRYHFIDKILNLLVIKEIIKKKNITKLKIISDNKSTINVFDNTNLSIEKKYLGSEKKSYNFIQLKIIKFYIKTFFLVLFMDKKKGSQENLSKGCFLSLYPNNFFYGKKNFFSLKKSICNFILSDETHLGFTLKKAINYLKITNKKKINNIEEYIHFTDLIKLTLKTFLNFNKFPSLRTRNFIIENMNFKNEISEYLQGSIINRYKLEIYKNAIPRFLKKFNVKEINLYLFEYSFGFFLIRSIKEFSKGIKIKAYQHGTFSENLMWFDLINLLNFKKIYYPNIIYSLNKYSLKNYQKKLKNVEIKILNDENKSKRVNFINKIKIKNISKNILVLPGTHDVQDIYYFIKNSENLNRYNFYFKLHPKNKFNFGISKNILKIKSLSKMSFSNVIISQTSSLVYDFLISKKKFSVIDLDYKKNLFSDKLVKKVSFKI